MSYSMIQKDSHLNIQHAFVLCAKENLDIEFKELVSLMDELPCSIMYHGLNDTIDSNDINLTSINVMIVIITEALLKQYDLYKAFLNQANYKKIPVITVRFNDLVLLEFESIFGSVHNIDLANAKDDLLKKNLFIQNLSKILLNNSKLEDLQKNFSKMLFLSYRKKDRQYVEDVMRHIHQNDNNRDVGIWFDASLTPGHDYNHEIKDALLNSTDMLLLVTNHLMEEGNYVLNTEYPMALENSIKIYPIGPYDDDFNEALFTKTYSNTQPLTSPTNQNDISKILGDCKNKEDTANHLFLIGMAYLLGVHVEQDIKKGEDLLVQSANKGYPLAIFQLGYLYMNGYYFPYDINKGLYWLNLGVEYTLQHERDLLIPNYKEQLTKKPLDKEFALKCQEHRELSEYCLMILKAMKELNQFEKFDRVSRLVMILLLAQEGYLPLISIYNRLLVGYEKIKLSNGKYKIGKGIYEDQYHLTGKVINPDLLSSCHIILEYSHLVDAHTIKIIRNIYNILTHQSH